MDDNYRQEALKAPQAYKTLPSSNHTRLKEDFYNRCYLRKASPRLPDGHPAVIFDPGPQLDHLARDVTSFVQPHPTADRPRQARHAQLVLDLAQERLLQWDNQCTEHPLKTDFTDWKR